jgi:hypothetical protein
MSKNNLSRVPLIESPCCQAPSTTMNPIRSDYRSNERKCIRCRQVFCRIDVSRSRKSPLKVVVGARAE